MANAISFEQEKLLKNVDKDLLMEYTKNISKNVRLSGTEEELEAFKYIQKKLESFGLETSLEFIDAFISLPMKAFLKIGDQNFDCITHAMAKPTIEKGLTAELVYIGNENHLDKIDVTGKIVLLEGLAIPGAVYKAQENGAIAALFINGEYTHEMVVSKVWGNPTPETVDLLPEISVASINFENGSRLKEMINKNEQPLKAWLKTEVDTGWRKIPLLTAEIKGVIEPDRFVLFSGHVDSWHYGAMDNGSANATMIEVARILAENKNKLRRTLRFAFWSGHSHGRYAGSTWYCDENWEDLYENCILHINIDSVGAKGATILSEGNCMEETKELAAQSIKAIADVEYNGSRFGRAGDQSFWGPGVPSLFMGLSEQPKIESNVSDAFKQLFGVGKGGGFGWWWHTTEDTMDKIDPDNLERDCKIYTSIVYQACTNLVYPIDQLSAVSQLREVIEEYKDKSNNTLEFSITMERISQLEEEVAEFYNKIKIDIGSVDLLQVNNVILKLSKVLVPLNYVKGSVFDHDLKGKDEPIPVLARIEELVNAESGSDEYFQLKTRLKRTLNHVNFTLKQALGIVHEANRNVLNK